MNNFHNIFSKKTNSILIPFMILLLFGYFAIGPIPTVKALPTCRIADITTVGIAEPSFPSPDDKDGFPDGAKIGNADPGDFQLVVRCDIDSTYSGVKVELLNPDHDPFNDESPDIVDLIIDNDNPKNFASLSTGTYYFYWSLDKDQSAALRGDAEQFQVNLSWTNPAPGFVLSDLFNIRFQQSASINQNDLVEKQVSPTIVSVNPGDTFRVYIKWEQSSSSLYDLAAEIYFNGSLIRLYNFSLYYYDVDGVDPGDITGGIIPPGWTQAYVHDTYLNTTQLGALSGLSSSDYWIGCWDFEALTPGNDQLYLYSQTKLAATANWKIGQGTIPVDVTVRSTRITVIKDSIPDDPQDFTFDGNVTGSAFTLDDDGGSDATYMNYSNLDVDPGVYNITELVPSGWILSDISIQDPSSDSWKSVYGKNATLLVGIGEWINVTFVNTKLGKITVIKNTEPDNVQDFSYSITGGLSPSSFTLDDDGDNTNTYSNNITYNDLFDSNSTAIGSFWLDDEEGGTDPTYPNLRIFTVDAGSYNITEIVPGGWILYNIAITDPTGDSFKDIPAANATVVVGAGEAVSVHFENWQLANITVIKDSIPDDPQDFQFDSNSTSISSPFYLDDDSDGTLLDRRTFSDLTPGAYNITEIVPSGWNLTNIIIQEDASSNSLFNLADYNATLVVGPGEWINVTFENTKRGNITVIKNVIPDDTQTFDFEINSTNPVTSFILDDDGDNANTYSNKTTIEIDPGIYNVTEILPPSIWRLTNIIIEENSPQNSSFSVNARRALIVVDPGEWVNVTFENSKCGRISVIKNTIPEDPQDFSFVSDIELSTLDDDGDNTNTYSNETLLCDIDPGTYNITETLPGGWVLTDIIIQEEAPFDDSIEHLSDNKAEINLSSGEWVNVTFVNEEKATIIVVKDTIPDGSKTFYYTGTGTIGEFSLKDDGTSSNSKTFSVAPGQYNITELNSEFLISIGIQESIDLNSSFTLEGAKAILNAEPGETIQVTFTNEVVVPVGGYFTTANKFSLISPYLTFIAIAGVLSLLLTMIKRHRN